MCDVATSRMREQVKFALLVMTTIHVYTTKFKNYYNFRIIITLYLGQVIDL